MDTAQEVKNRLTIVDVVREYGALQPAGAAGNFKMLCPFHDDHNPSMIVSEQKGIAWCFSCNSGGDIFSFVQRAESCSFPEAVRILAEKAGIQVSSYVPVGASKKDEKERGRSMDALEEATCFFEKQLEGNERAKKIVAERNLAPEIIRAFRVGFAPDSHHALEKHLLEKGFSHKEMLDAGLTSMNQDSSHHDRFRNRIMFPIWNAHGQICAFGGRYIGTHDKAPKYLNSPETPYFKKSNLLYGLHAAKEAIREKKFTLLVEGYYDVLACHAVGLKNAVAVSGTAFTPEHARLLSRYSQNIALALDVDAAGQAAARRSALIAFQKNITVSVVSIPGGKDPDEAIRENKEEFLEALEKRQPVMEAFFHRSFLHRNPKELADKKIILDELIPLIHGFKRDIERDHHLQTLSEKLGTNRQILEGEYQRIARLSHSPAKKPEKKSEKIEGFSYILSFLFAFPSLFPEAKKTLLFDLIPEGEEKKIYKSLEQLYNDSGFLSSDNVWSTLSEEENEKWRVLSLLSEEKNSGFPEGARREELLKTLNSYNRQLINTTLQQLSQKIKETPEEAPRLTAQMTELVKLLHTFHT